MNTCTCCDERMPHPLGNGLCESCCQPGVCDQCQKWEVDESDIEVACWSMENQVTVVCSECRARNERDEWIEQTEAEVERLAEEHGWTVDAWTGGFNTSSRYAEIWREIDDEGNVESFKIRVSDHGSAHCTEDISLAMQPSGDDHTIETLITRLRR